MSNHVHILIHTENVGELSKLMKTLNEDYARYYNYVKNRVGYVYRDRYLSEPITNRNYLLNCISYIHNNPVKAGIVKKCEEYKYSSYNDYINKTNYINDDILELLFNKRSLPLKEYIDLHTKKQKYYFMEYENDLKENMKEIISDIEKRYEMSWNELIKINYILKKIVPEIKERIRISNLELSRYLKTNRHKVERILIKNKNNN